MVITFQDRFSCDNDTQNPLLIDSAVVNYKVTCFPVGGEFIKTYTITDPEKLKYVLGRLRSDFTVVLSGDIKVWAGNILKPVYGTGSPGE
ncbi:hypothetical protein M7963_23045 [Enterobacter roggenkampii]|uniref:hypothetical protein n=1 Tax=Enterobacter roggenkampii TaxID=1812935 RepID=UPI002239059C|nr:hypothetical protein [Enterobacter roggenkampii]MCW5004368.1 hypothetical protein [Enterobacter roggenkampii]